MIALKQRLIGLIRMTVLPAALTVGGIAWTVAVPALRLLAAVSFVVAAVALASDAGPAGTGGPLRLEPTPVLSHWRAVAPASLDATQSFIVKRMRPWVWDAVSAPLRLPSFVFFCGLGLLLGYLGRHRRQVAIFSN